MKLLTKVLMTVALIGTCNVWGDSYSTYEYGDGRYQRVSLSSRSSPAYATNRYLDPNHEAMIASKLYTKDDAECMTKEALKRFLDDFGIDFSTVTPDEFGQRLIPGVAIFYPYVYGLTIADKANVLISDTAYPDRSYTSEWFWVEYGQIVIFLKDGEVPAGAKYAGAKYNAAQFWFFADHNVLKNNSNYARPYNREVLKVRTSNLAEGAQNQDNRQHAQVTFDVFDEQDRQGLFISCNIATVRDGINFIEARVVMTWDLPVYGGEYNTYSSY